MDGISWVREAHGYCQANGCAYVTAVQVQRSAQAIIDERQLLMAYEGTLALWCSAGAHAFSELDPGRIIVPPSSGRDQAGNEVTIPARAYCGAHANGLMHGRTRPLELGPAVPGKYDPQYTAALEKQLGMTPSPSLSGDEEQ